MKLIVFMKQVPASNEVRTNPLTHTLERAGAKAQTNPDDLHALTLAVELKKRRGGRIVAVSMGPEGAEATLREALMRGADEAVLLCDRAFAGSDTHSTAQALAAAARRAGCRQGSDTVLLFGKQATDGDTAQVGPEVAALLDLPQATEVWHAEADGDATLTVVKRTDNGVQRLAVPLPCVLTVPREANTPPAPTLAGWEEAQQKPLTRLTAAALGIDPAQTGLQGSPTRVVRTAVPETRGYATLLADARQLADMLAPFIPQKQQCL